MRADPLVNELHRVLRKHDQVLRRRQLEALQFLPALLGFHSMRELLRALAGHLQGSSRPRVPQASRSADTRGRRFSEGVKTKVLQALRDRQLTSAAASRKYGPSLATIAKWKRAAGLSTPRRRRTSPARAPSARPNGHDASAARH